MSAHSYMQMTYEYSLALVCDQRRRGCRRSQSRQEECCLNIATESWMLVCPKFNVGSEARRTIR